MERRGGKAGFRTGTCPSTARLGMMSFRAILAKNGAQNGRFFAVPFSVPLSTERQAVRGWFSTVLSTVRRGLPKSTW